MAATVINGRKIAERIKNDLKKDIENIRKRQNDTLKLAILQIGENPSSKIYLNAQKRLADELGVEYDIKNLKKNISQKQAERIITNLNKDKSVTGIIVHTPTPKHIKAEKLFARIAPDKDAEGLNPNNIGQLNYENWTVAPCTPSACMALIDSCGINLRGKEVVIVGHSEIVGKPLSLMMLSRMATTTVCHIGTYEKGLLKQHVQRAEVLVVSVGKPHLIKGSWIRKGAIVIDVGISKYKGGIVGDVDFDAAKRNASHITPVPGGVGPLTAVMLIKNLVMLYKRAKGAKK